MPDEDFSRLEAIQQHIENAKYSEFNQSPNNIADEMVNLNAWKSFAGKMQSEYKRALNECKVASYHSLIFSQRSTGHDISPSIAKDYISAKCGEMQYMYDFAERVNSNLAYYLDSLRSILSALKQEMSTLNYTSNH